jgi:hypothetical protein
MFAKFLDGRPREQPDLMPFSPIHGMQAQIDEENVTRQEARTFLGP